MYMGRVEIERDRQRCVNMYVVGAPTVLHKSLDGRAGCREREKEREIEHAK